MKNLIILLFGAFILTTTTSCGKNNGCVIPNPNGGPDIADANCNGKPDYQDGLGGGGVGTVPGGAPGGSTAAIPFHQFALVTNASNSASLAYSYGGSVGTYGCYEAEKYPQTNYVSEQYRSHTVQIITMTGGRFSTESIINQDLLRDLKMDKATQDITTRLLNNLSNRTELQKMANQYVWVAIVRTSATPQGASGYSQETHCLSGDFFNYRTTAFEKKKIQDLFPIW